jgi:predicted transcriptional regulator YheO
MYSKNKLKRLMMFMYQIHPILQSMIPVVEGIAKTFGDKCEVVLHDLTNYNSTIVTICNEHVTGRGRGAPITNLGLKILKEGQEGRDLILNYKNKITNGKLIKSSSILIRDEQKKVIGCLCINYDMTQLSLVESFLQSFTQTNEVETATKVEEKFPISITELMEQMIEEGMKNIGKSIPMMSKEEKIRFVTILDNMGLFLIKGAVQEVAELLDVSKYTIYNYIEKKEESV